MILFYDGDRRQEAEDDCHSHIYHFPARNLSTRYLVSAKRASLVRQPNRTMMYFYFDFAVS
jgi:hypothetical protein